MTTAGVISLGLLSLITSWIFLGVFCAIGVGIFIFLKFVLDWDNQRTWEGYYK